MGKVSLLTNFSAYRPSTYLLNELSKKPKKKELVGRTTRIFLEGLEGGLSG